MNKVVLIGRLTKDIELKSTQSGKLTTTFTLAVQRDKENADFIQCVAWERKAELLRDYTHKGSQVAIEGRIQTRNYESNGRKVYVTEVWVNDIQLLDNREAEPEEPAWKPIKAEPLYITDDELPF